MPCITRVAVGQTLAQRAKQIDEALARLERYLATGSVKVTIAPNGAVAFAGWQDRDDMTDACAFRTLSVRHSAALRRAVAMAERGGRRVNTPAVAAGWHSHDGGRSWGRD